MAIVAAGNTVFIRHLSPQVSESALRAAFGQCDGINRVVFKAFPGRSTEYYAQVDFKSSKGVVEAHKMSGTPILGVVCQVSVMDPGSSDILRKCMETQKNHAMPEAPELPSYAEPQGVQAEYMRKYRDQAETKRLKTVHVSGILETDSEEGLRALCSKFGEVAAMRMDKDGEGKPFALVEFKEMGPATVVKSRQGFVVDDRVIVFTESKTLIDTNAYVEQSVHFMSPFFDATEVQARGGQSHLTGKIAQARQAAAEIFKAPGSEEEPKLEAEAEKSPSAAAEAAAQPPTAEPIKWEGRSEKDFLRELLELSRRPPSKRDQGRSDRERRDRRRRRGSASASRHRDRRRSGSRRAISGEAASRKRRRLGDGKGDEEKRRRAAAAVAAAAAGDEDGEPRPETFDAEDLELAVVPNTELLVLGESSSYSSGEPSPERGEDPAASPVGASSVALVAAASAEAASPSAPAGAAGAASSEVAVATAGGAAQPSPLRKEAADTVMDVDEKEQWLPAVDVDEDQGSCDEVIVGPPEDLEDDVDVVEPSRGPAADAGAGAASPSIGQPPVAGLMASPASSAASTAPSPGDGTPAASGAGLSLPVHPAASSSATGASQPLPPRGSPGGQSAAGSAASDEKWECAACGEVNKKKRDQCNNCGGNAPWITVRSPDGDDGVDELSSQCSSSSSPAPSKPRKAASPARSVADSPARSIEESPAKSVANSGSARSITESEPQSVADLAEDDEGGCIDSSEEAEECTVEAERVRGEVADARARIFHGGS